jgi:hypothetical protein
MHTDQLAKKWRRLDPIPFEEIGRARQMAHQAVQFIASAAISYLPKKQDDSHTNCEWSRNLKALVGNLLGGENNIRLGLNISKMQLLLLKENWNIIEKFELANKNKTDVMDWLRENLENFNLDFNSYSLKRHYKIPDNSVLQGGQFVIENSLAFSELSDYFTNADLILREYIHELNNATPLRCWPHHFDIATLLNLGKQELQSIGIGLSPGDPGNPEPYFYVTMWPYPDAEKVKFPDLAAGVWNFKVWTGAALLASEILKLEDEKEQCEQVVSFIYSATEAIKQTLLPG